MIVKKTKQVTKEEVVKETKFCDKCGEKMSTAPPEIASPFNVKFECSISVRKKDFCFNIGHDVNSFLKTVDVCEKCSHDLLKLLEDNGYRINTTQE